MAAPAIATVAPPSPPKPKEHRGASVKSFNGLEPIMAIPRELSNQNWSVGKTMGKSSVDLIELVSQPDGLIIYSSPNGTPGQPKPGKIAWRTFVPMANLKDVLLED